VSVVNRDKRGLYLEAGRKIYRPGAVRPHSETYDMGDGGLEKGQHVRAFPLPETSLVRIGFGAGSSGGHKELHWHEQQPLPPPNEYAVGQVWADGDGDRYEVAKLLRRPDSDGCVVEMTNGNTYGPRGEYRPKASEPDPHNDLQRLVRRAPSR
jgi:hypothetical protein